MNALDGTSALFFFLFFCIFFFFALWPRCGNQMVLDSRFFLVMMKGAAGSAHGDFDTFHREPF